MGGREKDLGHLAVGLPGPDLGLPARWLLTRADHEGPSMQFGHILFGKDRVTTTHKPQNDRFRDRHPTAESENKSLNSLF